MAISPELRDELVEMFLEGMDRTRTEVVLTTGESFHEEALDIARAYMRATHKQRHLLQVVVKSWEQKP